jgi:hypothetical protein
VNRSNRLALFHYWIAFADLPGRRAARGLADADAQSAARAVRMTFDSGHHRCIPCDSNRFSGRGEIDTSVPALRDPFLIRAQTMGACFAASASAARFTCRRAIKRLAPDLIASVFLATVPQMGDFGPTFHCRGYRRAVTEGELSKCL